MGKWMPSTLPRFSEWQLSSCTEWMCAIATAFRAYFSTVQCSCGKVKFLITLMYLACWKQRLKCFQDDSVRHCTFLLVIGTDKPFQTLKHSQDKSTEKANMKVQHCCSSSKRSVRRRVNYCKQSSLALLWKYVLQKYQTFHLINTKPHC